jgi:hypothetical protein
LTVIQFMAEAAGPTSAEDLEEELSTYVYNTLF